MTARRGATATSMIAHSNDLAGVRSDADPGRVSVDGCAQTLILEGFPDPKLARKLSPNGRVHWAERAGAKREAASRIAGECLLQRVYAVEGPARIVFRWVFPTAGRHDLDNLIATAKPLIDALVLAGALEDDDSRHLVSVTAEAVHEPGQRRLEIVIEALAPAAASAGQEG